MFKRIILKTIRLYQKIISPFLGQRCRFYPTCSNYCLKAIEKHGLPKGGLLAIKRIIKCNPYNSGGIDEI